MTEIAYRVAYDLMLKVAESEKEKTKDREYWFTLYQECLEAVENDKPQKPYI